MNAETLASANGARRTLPDPLPLVGRARELADLEALLEDPDHPTSVVFLRGEGGVGKSRLAAELAERAGRRNWSVATGRAYPVETNVPYALFSDAWLPILRGMEPSTLTVLSRGGELELRYLFPALGGGEEELDPSGDPEELRTRLMWNFAEFVKSYARREPILCILEDLQWADESSLQLIHFLARQTTGEQVLFVCTYNDQERDRSQQLIQTERSLSSMSMAAVQHLAPLNLNQVHELVCRSFGVDGDSVREFSAVLFGWTRGNAFFLEEIVKSLVASGKLRFEGGTWVGWDAKEFGRLESIRDAVITRIRGFSDDAQAVAELAAIVGTTASYPLLESISGLDGAALLTALEELCTHRILDERSENGEVVYHFAHPLVRQILYGEFGLARARMLHGMVAEAMESYYGSSAIEHADELAFHFARTDGGPLRAKAAQYLAAAGRRALERRADQEAINYLQAALERTEGPAAEDGPSRADLVPLLARAHTHVGQFDQAAQLWASALEAVPPGRPEHFAIRRTLGMTHFWRGHHDEALEHFAAGLAAAETARDDSSVVRLRVAKAHCLLELGRGAEALETLEPALPLAERANDDRLRARVHRALALLHVWIGPPHEAEKHAERAIELAGRVGDLSIEFWARWGLAVLIGMRGDTLGMEEAIEEVNELADRVRSPVLRLWTADMTVELAYARGEWDRGIAEGEKAIALARSLNQRTLLPRLLVWTSQFYTARDDHDRAGALVEEAARMAGLDRDDVAHDVHQVLPAYMGRALHCMGIGDFTGAIEAAEAGLRIAEGTGYILWGIHLLLPTLGEACIQANEIERAAEVGKRLRAHAERIEHRLGIAWADACDSLVQWKRGDSAGSIPLMAKATADLEAIPMLWHATRLRRQVANRLWESARAEEAKEQLDRAWAVCVKIDAQLELQYLRKNYNMMGFRAPTIHRPTGPLELTPTEEAIAILVAEGLSNKAIAVRRNSNVRTVGTHLVNIYKKLEIGGPGARVRLGNLVREAGLLD